MCKIGINWNNEITYGSGDFGIERTIDISGRFILDRISNSKI